MYLNPGGILEWIVVGLIAGWLTGKMMSGRGYGLAGDLFLGLLGSIVGGFVIGLFTRGRADFIGTLIVSVLGAVIVVFVVRLVAGRRPTY